MKFDSRSRFSLAVLAVALVQTNLLAQQPPLPDKPASTTADRLKRYEDAIAPYVKQARETLPSAKAKYLAGLKTGEIFYVTIRLYDEKKRFEQVFVEVNGWTGSTISGLIASDLGLVKDHKKGEKITCKQGEVYDWTISKPDGTEEGNFVGKFLDTYQP